MRYLQIFTGLLIITLMFNTTLSAQSKKGDFFSTDDYTSIAQVKNTDDGKNISFQDPYNSGYMQSWAGTFNGILNSNSAKFYCIDLQHHLAKDEDYWDEGETSSEITYILNNYFPYNNGYDGQDNDDDDEAAAVQAAIWHYSDNVDVNTITSYSVRRRAKKIVEDTDDNHDDYSHVATLEIVPANQVLDQGDDAVFYVIARDINGNGVNNVTIDLATDLGTLDYNSITTGSNGQTSTITLNYNNSGTATVSATADVVIPHGTRYVYKQNGDAKQKLVLATPEFDTKQVTTQITWNETCLNTIGDFVWHDSDLDGKQDDGPDSGIENVVVQLLSGNNVIQTTTTDATGYYEFTNVDNGSYTVKIADVNFAAGAVLQNPASGDYSLRWFATKKDNANDGEDSDGHLTEHTADVTVNCSSDPSIDFGFFKVCVELEKSGPASVNAGETVTYEFTMTNCGDVLLSGGAKLYDPMLGIDGQYFQIPAGQQATFSKTYSTSLDDCGEITNNAWVIGSPSLSGYNFGGKTVRDDDDHSVTVNCEDLCGGFDVQFDGVVNNSNGTSTWTYTITGINAPHDLSHWVLALCEDHVVLDATPNDGEENVAKVDPTTGVYGIKWDVEVDKNGGQQTFSVTLNGQYDEVETDLAIKAGQIITHCTTTGPDCGDQCSGQIGDYVYVENPAGDCDGDQTNSTPIEGAVVKITYEDGALTVTDIKTTDAEGKYLFTGLCAGEYTIEIVSVPAAYAGYTISTDGSYTITLNNDDSQNLTADFGYCPPVVPCEGEIGDYVYVENPEGDCDGDQTNSTPIEGAEVKITYNDGNGTVTATTTTNAQGKYLFNGLCAGEYTVEITSVPQEYNGYTLSTDATYTIVLATDDATNYTADFGYCAPPATCDGEIGDRVWLDFSEEDAETNCNGIQDVDEPGIQGVKVILKKDGEIVTFTYTDENGYYLFSDLCVDEGCYTVHVDLSTVPNGSTPTAVNIGEDSAVDSDENGVEVCLTENNNSDLTIDFGFCTDGCGGCEEACLGDYIWFDANENGVQDNGEPGVEGVLVELYNQNGEKITSTHSDEDGFYRFDQLIPGRYYVRFIPSSDYVFTSKDQGDNDELDSDVSVDGRTNLTLFVAGYCDLSWDAGLVPAPPAPSCLGDRVWFDTDNDGIQDVNENGMGNITVKLLDANTSNVITTTTTDNYGNYKFDNLIAGAYKVMFVLPDGYEFTLKDQGNDNELDSDVGPTGVSGVINLGVSECQLYWDAGLYAELPDLRLNKETDAVDPVVGDQVKFTITITNEGSGDATGVEVTDYFPADGLTYNTSSTSQGTFNVVNGEGIWTVGNVNAGESFELELFFTVNEFEPGYDFDEFDLGVASDYNLFALCSVNFPSSDTECKVAVGWDAYFSYYSVGDKLNPTNGTEDALVVGRSLTFKSGAVYNGNVVFGTETNLPQDNVSIIGGSLIQDPNRIDFAAAGTYLKNLSANLGSYTINGTTTYQWGGLNLDGTDPFLNVFHVSGADLTESHTLTINVPNGSVVLVNIDGTDIEWNGGLIVNGTSVNNVLYNFYQATMITIQGIDIRGSVLAPCATVDFITGVQHGQMIAKYVIGQAQFNCEPFLGNIPGRPNITNTAEITAMNEIDSDSFPGNGVTNEDDYAAATVYFGEQDDSNGGGSGNDDLGDWEPIGEFEATQIIWSISADNNGNILAGTAGGELYRMTGENEWERLNEGMLIGFIWDIEVASNGDIYLGTEQGIFKSTNGGNTWQGPLSGLYADIRALEIEDISGDIYAAAWGFGIYKLANGSTEWVQVNNGLTNLIVNSISADSEGRLFAGTFGGGIYISTNGGELWTAADIDYNLVWALAVTSNDEIYAATYGKGVYRSVDNGLTWLPLNVGLIAEHVYGVAVNAYDEVYVSTWTGGVYKLSTIVPGAPAGGGNSIMTETEMWTPVGMNGHGISALMIDKNASTIYAGSSEGVIYKKKETDSVTDVESIIESPTEYKLSQNFPNPFNPSTTIEFGVKDAGNYKLKVYNSIGEQVAELVNGELNSGYHQVHFDASRLASGIYFYKLVGKNINLTRKMILMK